MHQALHNFKSSSVFQPVIAPLAEKRWLGLVLLAALCLQVSLTSLGLSGWQCPVKAVFGVPCPGCGMSRALALLFKGEWRAALAEHAFAPVFVLGGVLVLVVSLLPRRLHRAAVDRLAILEARSGIVAIVLFGLIAYWLARLVSGF